MPAVKQKRSHVSRAVHRADLARRLETEFPEISTASLMDSVVFAMQHVGQYKYLSGAEKKEFVVDAITRAIRRSGIWPEAPETLVSTCVDMIINVEKGRLKINPTLRSAVRRLLSCCGLGAGCCRRKAPVATKAAKSPGAPAPNSESGSGSGSGSGLGTHSGSGSGGSGSRRPKKARSTPTVEDLLTSPAKVHV